MMYHGNAVDTSLVVVLVAISAFLIVYAILAWMRARRKEREWLQRRINGALKRRSAG